MSDTLLEQIKAVLGADTDPLPNTKALMFDQMLLRILQDAETIKAAEALAIVAMNTQCATQEDADQLAAKVAAFRAAQEKNDG